MKILYFSVNMSRYTSASYQQDLIDSLKKKCDVIFWGPGYEKFDIDLDLNSIKKKLFISDNDCIIVGHSWLSDIPLKDQANYDNYYTWINERLIKNSIEYCGKINFFEHKGPKLFLLNKEYVSLDEKLNFAKSNNFDYVLTSNLNFNDYEKKTNLKFIFLPYAISKDFILKKNLSKRYDLFFSGLIQNQYFFNLNKIKSQRILIQKKLFYNFFDMPIMRKSSKFKILWNAYTGTKVKDIILKILRKYKRMPKYDYIEKLHESKVVLNTLSPDNLIGPRFYETMASRAICLCEESDLINTVFKPMEHYVPFHSIDEILEKLSFCLSDSIEIEKIRENSYDYVVSNHTYDIRADNILKLIQKIQ